MTCGRALARARPRGPWRATAPGPTGAGAARPPRDVSRIACDGHADDEHVGARRRLREIGGRAQRARAAGGPRGSASCVCCSSISRATSGSRAHSSVGVLRAASDATVVPHEPPPSTPTCTGRVIAPAPGGAATRSPGQSASVSTNMSAHLGDVVGDRLGRPLARCRSAAAPRPRPCPGAAICAPRHITSPTLRSTIGTIGTPACIAMWNGALLERAQPRRRRARALGRDRERVALLADLARPRARAPRCALRGVAAVDERDAGELEHLPEAAGRSWPPPWRRR